MARAVGRDGADEVALWVNTSVPIGARGAVARIISRGAIRAVVAEPLRLAHAGAIGKEPSGEGSVARAVIPICTDAVALWIASVAIGAHATVCPRLVLGGAVSAICAAPHVSARAVAPSAVVTRNVNCLVVAVAHNGTRLIAQRVRVESFGARAAIRRGFITRGATLAAVTSVPIAAMACARALVPLHHVGPRAAIRLVGAQLTAVGKARPAGDTRVTVRCWVIRRGADGARRAGPHVSARAIAATVGVTRHVQRIPRAVSRYCAREETVWVRVVRIRADGAVFGGIVLGGAHPAIRATPVVAARAATVPVHPRNVRRVPAAVELVIAHVTALGIPSVVLVACAAVRCGVIFRGAIRAVAALPMVRAGAIAPRRRITHNVSGMAAAVRRCCAHKMAEGKRPPVPRGTSVAVLCGVVHVWAHSARWKEPHILTCAGAIGVDPCDA